MSEALNDSFLGTVSLKPSASRPGEFVGQALAADDGDTIVVCSVEASAYRLENHCCYALHQDEQSAYTFPNFRFNPTPPGIRTGPWPGWRGIPGMPDATMVAGSTDVKLHFEFWGDEFDRHILRAVGRIAALRAESIAVRIADPKLIPSEAHFYKAKRVNPSPLVLSIPQEILKQHPRLLINQRMIDELMRDTSVSRAASLQTIRQFVPLWDRPFVVTTESKLPSGPEHLSPEDKVLVSALLALVEPDDENVKRGVTSLLEYTALTKSPRFVPLTIDTQSGETLFLLCVGYDWLLKHLSAEEETIIRKRIWEIADICWNHLGYERNDYAQAHYLGCGLGLLSFSLLFWGSHPRAREWGSHLAGVFALVLSLLPPDGFFAHGINLWIYEFSFLLRWMELLRSAGGWDPWPATDVMRRNSAFRAAATSPDDLCGITFGDPQYRVGGDSWCHYLIGLRTGSPEACNLGDRLADPSVEGVDYRNAPARRRVYEFLWRTEVDHHTPPSPQLYVTPDGGQVFLGTQESLFTFRSGPPLGRHRVEQGLTGGYGHSDPCNGSFLLYQKGSLLVAGPGPVYRRDTSLHNVVTINGRGQIGDTAVWMPDFLPSSTHAPTPEIKRSGNGIALSVDLAPSYLAHLGVKSLRRALFVMPDEYILGADVVTTARRSQIEWNLHSWCEFIQDESDKNMSFNLGGGNGCSLTAVCVPAQKVDIRTGKTAFVPAYPNDGLRDYFLQLGGSGDHLSFIWCLTLRGKAPEILAGTAEFVSWMRPDGLHATFNGTWISLEETR